MRLVHSLPVAAVFLMVAGTAAAQYRVNEELLRPITPSQTVATKSGFHDTSHTEARKLARTLNLSVGQEAAAQPILSDRLRRIYGAMNDRSLAWHDRVAERDAIVAETDGKLMPLFTSAQQSEFAALEAKSHRSPVASSVQIVAPCW